MEHHRLMVLDYANRMSKRLGGAGPERRIRAG
jgi:hypothetical protein